MFYKYLAVLAGHPECEFQLDPTDTLTSSQRRFATNQFERFGRWWDTWEGRQHGL